MLQPESARRLRETFARLCVSCMYGRGDQKGSDSIRRCAGSPDSAIFKLGERTHQQHKRVLLGRPLFWLQTLIVAAAVVCTSLRDCDLATDDGPRMISILRGGFP